MSCLLFYCKTLKYVLTPEETNAVWPRHQSIDDFLKTGARTTIERIVYSFYADLQDIVTNVTIELDDRGAEVVTKLHGLVEQHQDFHNEIRIDKQFVR